MLTQTVIDYFGGGAEGVRALAEALNITRNAIYLWGERVPRSRQFEIQVLTEGGIKVDRREHETG